MVGALVKWFKVETHIQKGIGSNPSARYWMDIFSHYLICCKICFACLKKTKIKQIRGPIFKNIYWYGHIGMQVEISTFKMANHYSNLEEKKCDLLRYLFYLIPRQIVVGTFLRFSVQELSKVFYKNKMWLRMSRFQTPKYGAFLVFSNLTSSPFQERGWQGFIFQFPFISPRIKVGSELFRSRIETENLISNWFDG